TCAPHSLLSSEATDRFVPELIMFPSLRLPVADAMWQPSLSQCSTEAWLSAEEARYAARMEAIRNRVPLTQPIGFDPKAQVEEVNAQVEEQDQMEEEEEELTDDDGPADRF
ncbi:unnamed protein product, partial [Polarella glacialis]